MTRQNATVNYGTESTDLHYVKKASTVIWLSTTLAGVRMVAVISDSIL